MSKKNLNGGGVVKTDARFNDIVGSSAVFKIFCKRANCDAQMISGA